MAAATQGPVLIVESDPGFAQQIQKRLTGYGISSDVVADADSALNYVTQVQPTLIFLCVELPGKSGYSVCNKLKKTPGYQAIPIIVMSAEATAEVFDQHRELKSRADDYVFKPISVDDLLARANQFIGLPDDFSDNGTQEVALEDIEVAGIEISEDTEAQDVAQEQSSIGLDDIVIDDGASEDSLVLDENANTSFHVDSDIADATEAAFAAISLEMPEKAVEEPRPKPSRSSKKSKAVKPVVAAPEISLEDELDAPTVASTLGSELNVLDSSDSLMEPLPLVAIESEPVPSIQSIATDTGRPMAPMPDSSGEIDRLRATIGDLEEQNGRLKDELDQSKKAVERSTAAASTASTSGASRDRELLQLREVINKKEKEILDLKDDVDVKERQIFDHRDKVRQLERRVQDMDEKLLAVEREMIASQERTEALERDKQQALERESNIKLRLEQAKSEIDKTYRENEQIRHKLVEEQRAVEERANARIAKMESDHQAASEKLKAALSAESDRLRGQNLREVETLKQNHEARLLEEQAKLAQLTERHNGELVELTQKNEQATRKLQSQQQRELETLRGEHVVALQQSSAAWEERLQQENDRWTAEKQRIAEEHENAQSALRSEQQGEIAGLNAKHANQIKEVELKGQKNLEELEAKENKAREALRAQLQEELQRALSDQKQEFDDRVAGLSARHKQEVTAGEKKAQLAEQLAADYQQRWKDVSAKIGEGQLLADKVKRALAVGIALLDEQQRNASDAAEASPSESSSASS